MKFTLVLTAFLLSSPAFAAKYSVVSGRSVEQRSDTIYEMIGKELLYTPKTADRFKSIQAAIEDFKRLLASEDEITPENREHIETYIAALRSLPKQKQFKKDDCDDYEVEPKAKPLLDGLCQ